MKHVSLHSVGTYHKNFNWEKKKNILCRVSKNATRQSIVCQVSGLGHSAKITTVSYKRLLTALCRASLFAKCLPIPRLLFSVNVVVTKSRSLPSATLVKDFFAECPIKSTHQSVVHTAKSQIPVMTVVVLEK
jgi:hypothetical protein